MANILDRYGIKEVADVTFYELNASGQPTKPALYLDTLKVSTIEQTAEEATANGGKGNAPLIVWDYGKEITVTLEDALFSAKSLAIMFGDGEVKTVATNAKIMRTESFVATSATAPTTWQYKALGNAYTATNISIYDAKGDKVSGALTVNDTYFITYDVAVEVAKTGVIEISANSFPGTYYVTGDTYARNEASGRDEFFQFIIPKAKVQSENTITMEADGDPSVFNMNLKVLRPRDGVMMKLVKYELSGGVNTVNDTSTIPNTGDLK